MIETKRLILRNYTINDLEDYWEYIKMPNIGPRCGWVPYDDKEKAGLKEFKKIKNFGVWHETGLPCEGVVCKITREEYLENEIYQNKTKGEI